MRTRTKKRFESEEQILQEMEKLKETIKRLSAEADQEDEWSKGREWSDYYMQAKDKRRKAYLMATNGMEKLKHKLAEFRTPQIPGLDNGDRSIQA